MCWPHVNRNLEPQLKRLRAFNKNLATKLQKDIENCQWGNLLREKYLDLDPKTKVLTETKDVRSQPLGQKRKPGRPKKEGNNFPHCLTTSPAPAPPAISRFRGCAASRGQTGTV